MRLDKCALLCAILALSILEPITARKSFGFGGSSRHSYPKSPGLSGHGSGSQSHAYPPSSGHSGTHSQHTGGSHAYPPSSGLSGQGNSHGYPPSHGLSGNSNHGSKGPASTTNINHHYHYNPPQQINYSPYRGAPAMSYPVYHGTPPTYVYQYKDSGSKYGTLLAGLALLNLGTLGVAAYAVGHNSGGGGGGSSYKAQPGEICKFGIKKENNDYEETRIDCNLISSFILQDQATQQASQNKTTVTTTTTVTNVTMLNNTHPVDPAAPMNHTETKILYEMLPNGTLIPVNVPVNSNATVNVTSDNQPNAGSPASSVVTTTTTNTTVVNALDVKGKPIDVTPGMQCYVIRNSPVSNMRKSVPCGLLQTYAEKSISRNSAGRSLPTFAVLTAIVAAFVIN